MVQLLIADDLNHFLANKLLCHVQPLETVVSGSVLLHPNQLYAANSRFFLCIFGESFRPTSILDAVQPVSLSVSCCGLLL